MADLSITPGTLVQFNVNVSGAPAINGYFVQLTYDRRVLDALSLDYGGNVLESTGGSLSVGRNCVNGFGVGCLADDSSNVVSFAIFVLGLRTSAPTNGLLFSVTFNIVANGFSEIHLRDVELSSGQIGPDGKPVPIPVSSFDGYFTNIDCPSGSGISCTPPIIDFTVSPSAPVKGDLVTFNASASSATNSGATITLYSWVWEDGNPGQQTTNPIASHTFTAPGNPYSLSTGRFLVTLTVTDTYGVSASFTKLVIVSPPPPQPDFSIHVVPSDPYIIAGKMVKLTVNVTSLNSFSGTVNLTVTVSLTGGPINVTASLSTASLIVLKGGSNSTRLTLSAAIGSAETIGEQIVFILHGTSGPLSRSTFIYVSVVTPRPAVTCEAIVFSPCEPFTLSPGDRVDFPIFITSFYGFNGTVALSAYPCPSVSFLFDRTSLQLGANQTVAVAVTMSVSAQAVPGDNFQEFVFVSGTSGGRLGGMDLFLSIRTPPLPPDFHVQAPPSLRLQAGENATLQIGVSSLNGFVGEVAVLAADAFQPGGSVSRPSITVVPSKITLISGQTAFVSLGVSTTSSTQQGNYTIDIVAIRTVDGRVIGPFRDAAVTVNVLPPATPPVLIQFHWKHRVSLSIRGLGAGTETFVAGVYNPNNSTTLYVSIRVAGVDRSGGKSFTASSQVVRLLPEQSLTNIKVAETFDPSTVGLTFTFTTTIRWGVDPSALSETSTMQTTGVRNSGVFKIVP